MANLTTKELSALEDQLGFEKMLCCKYQNAADCTTDPDLKSSYTRYASQHQQNYQKLLGFLQ